MSARYIFLVVLSFGALNAFGAAINVDLGVADSFAVLGGSTVTNTGASIVHGDLGLWPGTSVTGFPPGIVTAPGTMHVNDTVAMNAQNALTMAYNFAAMEACGTNLSGQDLGGLTL